MRALKENRNAITLISLVITIVVLLILASITTYSGINVINSSKLTAFTTELKIMQTQINELYQKDKNGEKVQVGNEQKVISDLGEELSQVQEQANIVFQQETSGIESSVGYRYWSNALIKELGIEGVEQDFFINLEKRSVISYEGFKYEGKIYYTLDQLPDGLYNVDYNDKNINVDKPTFNTSVEKISESKWRVTIFNIQYKGYINKWKVQYQLKNEQENWNTSEDLSFVVNKEGNYIIKIVNGDIESDGEERTIGLYIEDGLLLRYDGIENTRGGNNPSATSWEDLSGNNNDGIFYNINNNPDTVTDTDKGYYSEEEKGYVFLHNDSYIKSINTIGISGDANFTIEIVSNMWEGGKNPNYSPYTLSQPAWWGSSIGNVGRSCVFGYNRSSNKLTVGFINNAAYSDGNYDLIGKTSYISFRKTKVGQIKNGDTDIGKINYNGQDISSTYTGTATFTTNLVDSEVQVGRCWQWGGRKQTFLWINSSC